MEGRRVYLHVTEHLLNDLSQAGDTALASFVGAVKQGPPWVRSGGVCQRAYETAHEWRSRGLSNPPFIAYLALFVLAAGLEGDFASHAYYPRLRSLLGEPHHTGMYPWFDRMWELWCDLEQWATGDTHGSLGLFSVSFAVKWPHVGIPTAQALLTEAERHALPWFFSQAALDPTSPPSDTELNIALAIYGPRFLSQRTLRLLDAGPRILSDRQIAILDIILDELLEWDGECISSSDRQSPSHSVFAGLRLGCQLDEVSSRARFDLRCRTHHAFPEDGLGLSDEAGNPFGRCEEFEQEWSLPLTDSADRRVDAARVPWSRGITLRDTTKDWRLTMPPSPVRIFVSGVPEGIRGLVEIRQLPRGDRFFVAVEESHVATVEQWGHSSCEAFRRVHVIEGMPPGWRMYGAERALSDSVRTVLKPLSFARDVRILLEGGVKCSGGYQYFAFALPSLRMVGTAPAISLFCNDKQVVPVNGRYELDRFADDTRLVVEAKEAGQVIKRLVLFAVNDVTWPPTYDLPTFDRIGCPLDEDAESGGVSGARVVGFQAPTVPQCGFVYRGTERTGYLVGRVQGEVLLWPKERMPAEWDPVWFVPNRVGGKVEFLGRSVRDSSPVQPTACQDIERVRTWNEIIWKRRKLTLPPRLGQVRHLWEEYQRVASRAF